MVLVNFFLFIHFAFLKLNDKIMVNYIYLGAGGRARGGRYGEQKIVIKVLGYLYFLYFKSFYKPVH